jgi:hypothetical protein
VTEKQRRDKELARFHQLPPPEDWSCAKCGAFQKVASVDIKNVTGHVPPTLSDDKDGSYDRT